MRTGFQDCPPDDKGETWATMTIGSTPTGHHVIMVGLAFGVESSNNLQVSHTDGLGSVRAITDNNGSVIETDQTDAFAAPILVQGTSAQPFQFTSQ